MLNTTVDLPRIIHDTNTFVDGDRLPAINPNQPPKPIILKIGSKIKFANLETEITRHV